MRKYRLIAAAIGLAAVTAPAWPAGAEDKTILIELTSRSLALPSGVSASGSAISGTLNSVVGGAFYWMPTTGWVFAGGSSARDISADGRTLVGTALDPQGRRQAAIWLRSAEWRLLGALTPSAAPCNDILSGAYDTSADGRVVVGDAYNGCGFNRAFRWEEATGMVDLGTLVPGQPTTAYGISGNGRVIVGRQFQLEGTEQGTKWVDNRQEHIPVQAGNIAGYVGPAKAANADGSIVVGESCYAGVFDQSAWVWTASGGTVCLPPPTNRVIPGPGPAPPVIGEANATSDDGHVIGGGQRAGTADSDAVIWIDRKPVYLKDYLRANGVPTAFEGWPRTGAIEGISADGRILVGWGAAPENFRGYMVILGAKQVMP